LQARAGETEAHRHTRHREVDISSVSSMLEGVTQARKQSFEGH
jgi:hypothetical protein